MSTERLAELLRFWEFLGLDPFFRSRWGPGAPGSRGGQGAGYAGCAAMLTGAATVALQRATESSAAQAKFGRIAARGGFRIQELTPADRRRAATVDAWRRKI